MRLAVVSDIHGNCVAFDAVIEDVTRHSVDRWICLGDAVQGGAQPNEVVDRLRALDCTTILGNADAFVLTGTLGGASSESLSEPLVSIRKWTAEQLGDEGLAFLRTFVPTQRVDLGEPGSLLCFHGTPASYDEVLLPETPSQAFINALGESEATVLCGGHTHLQWTTTFDGKTYFNPGSVGLAFSRHLPTEEGFYLNPFAEYAILSVDGGSVRLEFCKVMVDVDAVIEAIGRSGRPFRDRDIALYRGGRPSAQ